MSDWPFSIPAQLKKGKLSLNKHRLAQMLKGRRDAPLRVTFDREHAHRSLAANAYYWSCVCGLLAEHTGHEPEDIHLYLKSRFLPKKLTFVNAHGEIVDEFSTGRSTAVLNKLDFGDYLERCVQFAAESLGVMIPPPDPNYWQKRGESDPATD